MDQRAHAGNHHQHHGSEPVYGEIDVDLQRAALNPGEVVLDVFSLERTQRQQRFHHPGNDSATEPMAKRLIMAFGIRRPKRPLIRKPSSGKIGISQRCIF